EEALLEMPIGIILYNDDYIIEWANPYMNKVTKEETLVGKPLHLLSDDLLPLIKEDKGEGWLEMGDYMFQARIKQEERLLYFFDRTEQNKIKTLYQNDQTIIAIIYLDNYEEVTQNMDDTIKSQLNSKVTSVLNNWSHAYGLYLKRTSQDRFLAIGTREILDKLEKTRFDIMDEIRETNTEQNVFLTISIGIGHGAMSLPELGELAQSSLDLALGRGGDQAVIKDDAGKVRFYGGKTNPMEKRTRVRARVISHALKQLVQDSDNVIIMGHKSPDMDSLGAAIGVLNIAISNNVDGFIVLDDSDVLTGISKVMDKVKKEESLYKHFIGQAEADAIYTSRSLVVVVDTHRPGMTAHEKLLRHTSYKVVIDHHRRGEDFVDNPTLVYME